jgi:hypothetical protein
VVTVPAAAAAKVHLLFDPARGTALGMACTARVNGQPQAVRTVEMPTGGQQAHLPHDWIWFEFDLAPGRNQVEVSLTPKSEVTYVRGEVGWWLWLEQPLARRALAIEFDQALAPASAEPLPVPIGQGSTRTLLTLAKPAILRLGSRWPAEARTQAAVWLDEVAPDEVTQEWGKLQKNQSVWEKEMIVAGRRFSHGLGTHANGRLSYELEGGGFERFRCLVGRDEHAGDGRIEFEVWVDGNRVFASGAMTRASPALAVAVDLAGARILELRTLDSGDGINGDHGNWADAQLLR